MTYIDKKYLVLKKLGEGFGGSVFLVESDGKRIALKQLLIRSEPGALSPSEILENFKQEFSTLKQLNHPHILRILDFGYDARENFYYFTTEFIEGREIFEATRGLSPEQIEELFVQVLRALSYLHSRRVYHFDIKPRNILVAETPDGHRTAKLIDFGLTGFQKKGVLAGTPAYMAPETLLSEPGDGRVDLYSLALTWFKCLTGENPFESEDIRQTIQLQRIWVPPALSSYIPSLPTYLDHVFKKLLEKNPVDRYHFADQVIRDLNWGGDRHYPLETAHTALAYLPGEGNLVGRDQEWAQLLSLTNRVFVSQSDPKICVTISGQSGTGKSRLLKELKFHAQLHNIPVQDLNSSSPADLKSDCLLLADNANAETVEIAHQWMGRFLNHSVMIVLAGVCVQESVGECFKIQLNNFDRDTVCHYISSVLGMIEAPEFLTNEIFSRTEGNPLLLTELLQALLCTNQIFDEQGRWSATFLQEVGIDFKKLSVPKTLVDFCQGKFAMLSSGARKLLILQALSQSELTRPILTRSSAAIEASNYDELLTHHLIRLDPVSGAMRLTNTSFIDWIAQNIDESELAQAHQTLGEIFNSLAEHHETTWFHMGHGTGPIEERYAHLSRYGEALLQQHRWVEAARIFEKLASMAVTSEKRVESILKQVVALFRCGKSSDALSCLEASHRILRLERGNPEHWKWVQRTFREMASIYLKEGRLDLARESLQASRVLIDEHGGDPIEEMLLENFKISIMFREGKVEEASNLSESSFRKWQSLSDEEKKLILNNELPSIYQAQGKLSEAYELFKQQANFCKKIENSFRQAFALYGTAESSYALKNFPEAKQVFQECMAISRSIHNEELLFCCMNGLGNIAFSEKDWVNAEKYYQDALELSQHCANGEGGIAIAFNLALVFQMQNDRDRAHIFLHHVIDTLEKQLTPSLPQLIYLVQSYLEIGRIQSDSDHFVKARDAYRDATRLIRKFPALERFRFFALLGLLHANHNLGLTQDSQNILAELEKESLGAQQREELENVKKQMAESST